MPLTRSITICCTFLFLAGVVSANIKKFNVVSFGKEVAVSINGNWFVRMERIFSEQPLYSVEVDVTDPIRYHYIEDGVAEEFQRVFPEGAAATFNDFFGREDTIKHLPQLPMPFEGEENGQWTRGMGQVNPFNETYIPTVHFTGKHAKKFFKSATSGTKHTASDETSVFFILQNETKLFKNVGMTAWSTQFSKISIRLTLGDNEEYYGRNVLKFRFGEKDPTFMREKLYTDLLVAVGAPVHKTNLVRVYVNRRAVGLYILQDESSDEKFIQTEFYANGNAPAKMGYPVDADTGADFFWTDQSREPNDPWDAFTAHAKFPGHRNYRADATNDRVVALAHALHKLDPTDEAAVKTFDQQWFDIDTFFKAMVFEYALGHWDSYWGLTSNFALYDDPTESNPPESYKFYFLDEDFEFTFGSCLSIKFNEYGREFTKQSYKTLLNRTWGVNKDDAERRTMLDKLLSTPALTLRFELILIAVVKHLLNPAAMFGRIDAMAERYRPEIKWERSLKRLRDGKRKKWTLEDLDYGINGYPNGSGKFGIQWGLKQWIQERADAVAKEFNFNYSKVETYGKEETDPNPGDIEDIKQNSEWSALSSGAEIHKTAAWTVCLIATSAWLIKASVHG